MVEQACEALDILLACDAESERPAQHDRPVATRQIEEMHGLDVQRRAAPRTPSGLPARGNHVRRRVDSVDVEPLGNPRHEQPAGHTTWGVQSRLASTHEGPEVLDLRTARC